MSNSSKKGLGDTKLIENLLHQLNGVRFVSYNFTRRDRALMLMRQYNVEAQLVAIETVLRRNREDDEVLTTQIESLDATIRENSGEAADQLVDLRIDHLHYSVFQDAAHSMSAGGMLAPFMESLFVAIFKGLRENHRRKVSDSNPRAAALNDHFWDPHLVFGQSGQRRNIVQGVAQLSDSVGLSEFLPDDLERTLSALFAYRNKMFHHGFEWPLNERRKFEQTIRKGEWPSNWFIKSWIGDEPWIFYLSTIFIDHCLLTIDQVIQGVGAYLEQHDHAEWMAEQESSE